TCKPLPSCASLGYTQTSCPSNRAALKCPFDTAKVYCAASATSDCKVGSIYYSDDTCSDTRINSKTPIGVVFDAANRLVVALDEYWAFWGVHGTDTPLTNYTDSVSVKTDVNGKSNTDTLVSLGTQYEAANYCHNKTTGGKTWYLPAYSEMLPMFNSVVNSTLAVVGTGFSNNYYWSSTESQSSSAWAFNFWGDYGTFDSKSLAYYFRCVFKY
ncbi:MAG: DUF1566 domain-containing protein, partial [Alphaproteobacteria bacterium]|nr:DUF1566 domain-containing protein [Alphaproteobacteria bacterium]